MNKYLSDNELVNIKRDWIIDNIIPKNNFLLFNSVENVDTYDENAKRQFILEILLDICTKYSTDNNRYEVIYVAGQKIHELNKIINRWKVINNIRDVENLKFLYKNNLMAEEINCIVQQYFNNEVMTKNIIFVFDHVIINSENIDAICSIKKPPYYIKNFNNNCRANIWVLDYIKCYQVHKYFDIVYEFIEKGNNYKLINNTMDISNKLVRQDNDDIYYLGNC